MSANFILLGASPLQMARGSVAQSDPRVLRAFRRIQRLQRLTARLQAAGYSLPCFARVIAESTSSTYQLAKSIEAIAASRRLLDRQQQDASMDEGRNAINGS